MANGWRRNRRDRYGNLDPARQLEQVWDDLDEIDGTVDSFKREIRQKLDDLKEAFDGWRLETAANQSRTLLAVALALLGVLASIIVPLVTR